MVVVHHQLLSMVDHPLHQHQLPAHLLLVQLHQQVHPLHRMEFKSQALLQLIMDKSQLSITIQIVEHQILMEHVIHVTILFTMTLLMPKDVSQSTHYAKHGIILDIACHVIKDIYCH